MGDLVWGGSKDKTGEVTAEGHLSFYESMQDQIFSIDSGREGERRWSVMAFSDRGDYPITEALDFAKKAVHCLLLEGKAAWDKFRETHPGDNNRVVIGRASYNSSVLRLNGPAGRDRIVLKADAKGKPSVQMLDAESKVISQFAASEQSLKHYFQSCE